MSPQELYEVWAPSGATWSPWAKPVLFTHLHLPEAYAPTLPRVDVDWAPDSDANKAVIVDLPDAHAVVCGLSLAHKGYRPVPLYNTHHSDKAAVSVGSTLGALGVATTELMSMQLPYDAPPAFLLDSNRLGVGAFLHPGLFDNRWMIFPQDFPSGGFLLSRGIREAIVVQRREGQPQEDLRHVLMRWQEAGVTIAMRSEHGSGAIEPIVVSRPSGFRAVWRRALAIIGLRRNSAGGFGSIIPEPSSGRGGFG